MSQAFQAEAGGSCLPADSAIMPFGPGGRRQTRQVTVGGRDGINRGRHRQQQFAQGAIDDQH